MINPVTNNVAVENIQRYLRQLSLYDNTIPPLAVDGIFDMRTREALLAFQRQEELEETGVVDYTTWNRLFEAYMDSLLRSQPPRGFTPFPRFPVSYSVGMGNREFLVEIIQYILNELAVWMDGIPRNSQSGIFDEDTQNGTLLFQRKNLLPETGRVDRSTWNALVDAYGQMSREND